MFSPLDCCLIDLLRESGRYSAHPFVLVSAAFADGLFDKMVDTMLYADLLMFYCGAKSTGNKS